MMKFLSFFVLTICFSVSFMSCKKDKLLTDPSATVAFSQDSVLFDTVFTTIGSATRNIRVINNNNQKINISSIRLEQGASSSFFMNVDGVPGKEVTDVEILAHDSIYIFIQVNVNPTNALSPLIIQDRILFDVNGNQQSVRLEAWGQDAHYHFPDKAIQYKNGYLPYSTVSSSTTAVTVNWGGGALGQPDDDRPHVIYGWLVVDSLQKLVINPGVKVYFHQNAGLWVYRYGTLQVNGTLGNEVTFQGDRREADYADMPGQWDRIWINEGHTDNYINYAIIKNSFIGVQASLLTNNDPNKLKLTNTIIKNCSKWGLYTQFFTVWAANNVIVNCKEYCAAMSLGGNYTFLHNTFANYYNQDGGRGGQPCVHIDNYDGTDIWPIDSIYFANCIIEGSQGNEFEQDIKFYNAAQKCKISNCLIRNSAITNTLITTSSNVYNANPAFNDPATYNFGIKPNSAAKGIGDFSIPINSYILSDIKNSSRNYPSGPIDAGAYNNQ